MNWHTGNIAEAVAESKAKNAIFVVYIEGKEREKKFLLLIAPRHVQAGAYIIIIYCLINVCRPGRDDGQVESFPGRCQGHPQAADI